MVVNVLNTRVRKVQLFSKRLDQQFVYVLQLFRHILLQRPIVTLHAL